MASGIVPPYLLARLAQAEQPHLQTAALAARRTLSHDDDRRAARLTLSVAGGALVAEVEAGPDRTVYDGGHGDTLPGRKVRGEGDPAVRDVAVDEAYDGLGATFALYADVYDRDSIDGKGLPLDGTVHYETDYDNAFWNGEQMVFGDGDGQIFGRFTSSVDVIGHELTHGVTQYTVGLVYQGQSGALNESVSDVFGSLVLQYQEKQTAAQASWLIGAGLFTKKVHGVALRSMKAPGTAYDDPVLGKDPQPATMAGYVDTAEDDGGVHTNSGIPNHAFYLIATRIGGHAWETAGRIWYDTLLAGMKPTTDFAGFAALTLAAATRRYGEGSAEADAVRAGWSGVGVAIDGGAGSSRHSG